MVLLSAILPLLVPLVHCLPNPTCKHVNTSIPLRILPLGDSITWGWQPQFSANGTDGYRAKLLSDLLGAKYEYIDYVGTQHSGTMADNDNEGHSGYRINQIHDVMSGGLAFKPNVVLLHAGTNDLNRPELPDESWADAPKRLGSLIDDVLKACPDAVVIVAKIIQAQSDQTETNLKVFNDAIHAVVAARVQQGSKVTVVDQSVVGVDELIDGLHPTDAGYAHMGDVWYKGVVAASRRGLITPPTN